jgi:uncharacterized protein (DUF2336 family)
MTIVASAELIAELEGAVEGGSPARRVQMLQQVTDLFLSGLGRLDEHQIAVFDDVLIRLMDRVGTRALTQLGNILADLASVPKQAVRRLAGHEEPAVAAPVLLKSDSLSESDLREIAGNCSQHHLLAISGRKTLNVTVADVLVKRGNTATCRALAKNIGARFSDHGYSALVAKAERDGDIADSLVLRSDLPIQMLRELLARATMADRIRLLKVAPAEIRETIQAVIDSIAARTSTKAPEPIDYSEAKSRVLALSNAGKLNDSAVNRFAVRAEHTHVVAALALLAAAEIEAIEPLMEEGDSYGLMVACRASRLNWQTTSSVIVNRKGARATSQQELEQSREIFETLLLSVAQWTIRFGSVRELAMKASLTDSSLALAGAGQ